MIRVCIRFLSIYWNRNHDCATVVLIFLIGIIDEAPYLGITCCTLHQRAGYRLGILGKTARSRYRLPRGKIDVCITVAPLTGRNTWTKQFGRDFAARRPREPATQRDTNTNRRLGSGGSVVPMVRCMIPIAKQDCAIAGL